MRGFAGRFTSFVFSLNFRAVRSAVSIYATVCVFTAPLFLLGCASFSSLSGEDDVSGGPGGEVLVSWGSIARRAGVMRDERGVTSAVPARLFASPTSVSASMGYVYVVDSLRGAVYRYERYNESIRKMAGLPAYSGSDIHIGPGAFFYVTDPFNSRVLLFDPNGTLIRSYRDRSYLIQPTRIAVDDRTGNVYAIDGMRGHIVVFNAVGQVTRLIASREGKEGARFDKIEAAALWNQELYVVDKTARRVVVMNLDGDYLYAVGTGELSEPVAIDLDGEGRVFVADRGDNSVKVFKDGELVSRFNGAGGAGERFSQLEDIDIDGEYLYAADSVAGDVHILLIMPGEL